MGRIKTKLVKRITNELIKQYGENFKKEFEENKKLVEKYSSVPSVKMRNIIAGYVTRQMKNNEE